MDQILTKRTRRKSIIVKETIPNVIDEKPFQKDWFNYKKNIFLNKIFRLLIKVNLKKDNFSRNYIQKYPYIIDANIIKKKSKLLSPSNDFKIKNISMNLVEIDK